MDGLICIGCDSWEVLDSTECVNLIVGGAPATPCRRQPFPGSPFRLLRTGIHQKRDLIGGSGICPKTASRNRLAAYHFPMNRETTPLADNDCYLALKARD